MGKRIELTEIYSPRQVAATNGNKQSRMVVPQIRAVAGGGGVCDPGADRPVENGSRSVALSHSKPGPKPKVAIPSEVQAFLEKHGLRVVPKAKS